MLKRYDIDDLENRDPKALDRLYRWLSRPLEMYFRSSVRGLERIGPGAGLYVGNHSSGMLTPDSFIFGTAVYREHGLDGTPYGLGHEFAIQFPLIHQIVVPIGAVRASHENAHRLFARGRKVIVYPGGDIDAMRPFRHRNRIVFGGRRGYIRLAVRAGVPIYPVVSAGSHNTLIILDDGRWLAKKLRLPQLLRVEVWPIVLSIPWGLTVGPPLIYVPYPTRILIEVLGPIVFDRTGDDAANDEGYVAECGDSVESLMQTTLERLASELRGR